MISKRKLLQDYRKHLTRELASIDAEIDKLKGEGPEYTDEELNQTTKDRATMYLENYDADDISAAIGRELVLLTASDDIDEEANYESEKG